ncbi:helix-turn-helix domain-containing protein [Clostridium saccharoperbutylacetonicum]|uniref:helix-turn-helix domain-containing protein n=1 Tax=Clostridium saccharoperbutylacetonicum TaxID=36745 RepID=UPI0039EA6245
MSVFGDNLTLLRLDRGYTRPDMGDIFEISRYAYRNWEYGITQPSIENLIKLSRLFKVSIDELVGNKKLNLSNILDIEKFEINKKKLEESKKEQKK